MEISIEEQIDCVKREIAYRKNVYKRLVSQDKMPKAKAEYEIEAMRAVQRTLESKDPARLPL